MHEAPPSRGSPRPLTPVSPIRATARCPRSRASTGALACPCWSTERPAAALLPPPGSPRRRCAQARSPFGRFVTGPPSFWVVAGRSRNGRSLPCIASTARVRAPVSEPPGQGRRGSDRPRHRLLQDDDPARPRGTGRFLQWQPVSRPSIRSWRGLGDLRQRRSDGAEQGPVGQDQSYGPSGSTRRGARRVRLRVGGCTPACARDGLTGCRCRDGRRRLGHLADLSRGMGGLEDSL